MNRTTDLTKARIREFCQNRGEINRFEIIVRHNGIFYGQLKSGNWYEIDINEELEEAIPTKLKNQNLIKDLNKIKTEKILLDVLYATIDLNEIYIRDTDVNETFESYIHDNGFLNEYFFEINGIIQKFSFSHKEDETEEHDNYYWYKSEFWTLLIKSENY